MTTVKRITDLTSYTSVLPYASEMFGVYQPLLGWKSKRIEERFNEGFRRRPPAAARQTEARVRRPRRHRLQGKQPGRPAHQAGGSGGRQAAPLRQPGAGENRSESATLCQLRAVDLAENHHAAGARCHPQERHRRGLQVRLRGPAQGRQSRIRHAQPHGRGPCHPDGFPDRRDRRIRASAPVRVRRGRNTALPRERAE